MTQPPATQPAAAPAPARRGMGTTKNMIISVVVITLACLVWWAFVPRQQKASMPTVDAPGIAREVSLAKKWDVAIPRDLSGFRPVNVRLLTFDKQPATWQAGYDAPAGKYIAVVQAKVDADRLTEWVRKQTGAGSDQGAVQIGGQTWRKVERADGDQRALVRQNPLAGLDTVVVGTGSWAQLQQFAGALHPLTKAQLATSSASLAPSQG